MRMTAPIVPKGEMTGMGMKNGNEASTRWMRAAIQCPSSCASRMLISDAESSAP